MSRSGSKLIVSSRRNRTHDDKGFFYQRFPLALVKEGETEDLGTATASDKDAEVYYHRQSNLSSRFSRLPLYRIAD
jgi:hypothetical protein